jgi:hypothetical protein
MEDPEVPTEHLHEEMHHHAAHSGEGWVMGVALSSALLAVLAAIGALKAGEFADEAVISQIQASNQWDYYQSKGIKEAQIQTKTEVLKALGKPAENADTQKLAEYQKQKSEIQKKAGELEKEARNRLKLHEILARSVTLFQIAIAIGAVSVLTKRRFFWFVGLAFGVGGLFFLVHALL